MHYENAKYINLKRISFPKMTVLRPPPISPWSESVRASVLFLSFVFLWGVKPHPQIIRSCRLDIIVHESGTCARALRGKALRQSEQLHEHLPRISWLENTGGMHLSFVLSFFFFGCPCPALLRRYPSVICPPLQRVSEHIARFAAKRV